MCTFVSFIKFGIFSATVSLNVLSALLWDSHYAYIVGLTMCHKFLRLCSFFFIAFSYSDLVISIDPSLNSLVHSAYQYLLWKPSGEFFILVIVFQFQNFIVPLYNFYLFIDLLFIGCSSGFL